MTATTMSAWLQHRYGGAETVSRGEVPVPAPKPDEVIVRVRATALNAADVHLMHGDPYLVRLGFGFTRPKQPVRGMDIAGIVTAAGAQVADFAVGDEVVAEAPSGGLGAYATIPEKRLVRRPEGLEADAAAALPLAGGTAWQALDAADVTSAKRVLVIGASGGVGTYAVQLAAHRGAEVWALCGAHSRNLVAGLGATHTFDYRQTALDALPQGSFDAVIDIAGAPDPRVLHDLLAPGGTAVMVGAMVGRCSGRCLGCCGRACSAHVRGAASDRSSPSRNRRSCANSWRSRQGASCAR